MIRLAGQVTETCSGLQGGKRRHDQTDKVDN